VVNYAAFQVVWVLVNLETDFMAKIRQLSEEVLSRRQGFNPFLPNALPVEKSL